MSLVAKSWPQTARIVADAGTGEQHSIVESLALHLLPGVFILALFVPLAIPMVQMGLPSQFAMLAGSIVGLGFQIVHLFHQGKQRNGSWSLKGIVQYRKGLQIRQYLILVPAFTVLAFLINGMTMPLGTFLLDQMSWLPEWFEIRSMAVLSQYPKSVLVILFCANILINGLVAPVIEELYFRGYLMPRLARFGRATTLVETGLFTLYHFWQPYYWATVFLSMLPVVGAVAWKRNVKLGILTHATMNLVGATLTFALLLG